MFERYTEQARRALFFARYEASLLGSISIQTEHLLLGLIREATGLIGQIFESAADEADRLLHKRIGTEHMLLGLLRQESSLGSAILFSRLRGVSGFDLQLPSTARTDSSTMRTIRSISSAVTMNGGASM